MPIAPAEVVAALCIKYAIDGNKWASQPGQLAAIRYAAGAPSNAALLYGSIESFLKGLLVASGRDFTTAFCAFALETLSRLRCIGWCSTLSTPFANNELHR